MVSRNVSAHAVKLFAISTASIFIALVWWGAKHGALLQRLVALTQQVLVVTVLLLCVFLFAIRKKKPGFTWDAMIADYASWSGRSAAERAACTTFFLLIAIFCVCSGAMVAVLFSSFLWRSMSAVNQ